MDNTDMAAEKTLKKGHREGHMTLYFWALNCNRCKMAKYTNFKFGMRARRLSPDMAPEQLLKIWCGQGHVTT